MRQKLSLSDKWAMYREQSLKVRRSTLEEAEFTYPESTPWGEETEGMPSSAKIGVLAVPLLIAVLYWLYRLGLEWRYSVPVDPLTTMLGQVSAFFGSVLILSIFWKLNEGAFSDFRAGIVSPMLIFAPRLGKAIPSRYRIKRATQIYPLSDKVLDTAEEAEAEAVRLELEAAKRALEEAQAKKKKVEEDVKEILDSAFKAPVPQARQDQRRRPSSIEEVMQLIQETLGEVPPVLKPDTTISAELLREYTDMIRRTHMELYATFTESPVYDAVWLSERPLVGTGVDAAHGFEFLEFAFHDWVQKTYIYQKRNSAATWGVVIEIAITRHYVLIGKEWKMRYVPIFYVAASDGAIAAILSGMKAPGARTLPYEEEIQAAKDAMTVTLAEKLISLTSNQTATINRLENDLTVAKRQEKKFAKRVIREGLQNIELAKSAGDEGTGATIMRLLGGSATKMVFRLIMLLIVAFVILVAIQLLTGIRIFPFISTGAGAGGPGAVTTQP